MATKKKKAPVKKKIAKKAKPAPQVRVDPKEEYLLILINATKRYMKSPEDVMGQQLVRLEKELEEFRALNVPTHV
jgi:hypothetical protein